MSSSFNKEERFFVLTIKDAELFDAIRQAEASFIRQYEVKDLVRFMLVDFKKRKYIRTTQEKPRANSGFFVSDDEYRLINIMICSERPDLCENDDLVNSRCAHSEVGCNPSFDYSTGQPRDMQGVAAF